EGTLDNPVSGHFNLECVRLHDHLLALTAVNATTHKSFSASLTHCLDRGKAGRVLCGFWSGLTPQGAPAIYRLFLSTGDLDLDDLREITARVLALSVLRARRLFREKAEA